MIPEEVALNLAVAGDLVRMHFFVKRRVRLDGQVTGFNIGANVGADEGQPVFHLHFHGDVERPRGGVRCVIPGKQDYQIDSPTARRLGAPRAAGGLWALACDVAGAGVRRRVRVRLRLRSKVAIFGVPFRSRPTHVVEVGPIGAAAPAEASLQAAQSLRKVTPH
jgi:hypothetical protein